MQFSDLKVMPQIDFPKASWEEVYDPVACGEFRIEPSGKKVQDKLKKAFKDAAEQQKGELATAQEELAKFKPTERDYKILSTKITKTNTTGKVSYTKGCAVLRHVPRQTIPIVYEASTAISHTHIASSIGRRRTQEDTHVDTVLEVHGTRIEVTAVFDGHGETNNCSVFMKENIGPRLQEFLTTFNPDGLTGTGIQNALELVTVYLSREYQSLLGGSCANIVLKIGNTLWVANVGDSRAILVNKDTKTTVQLSKDQKAADSQYEKSIKKRNGTIEYERLDGCLIMAKTIGDHASPPNGAPSASSRSKVTSYELEAGVSYILVQGCDGLFDTMTSDHVGFFVLNRAESPDLLTQNLVAAVIEDFASDDNVTVIIRYIPAE